MDTSTSEDTPLIDPPVVEETEDPSSPSTPASPYTQAVTSGQIFIRQNQKLVIGIGIAIVLLLLVGGAALASRLMNQSPMPVNPSQASPSPSTESNVVMSPTPTPSPTTKKASPSPSAKATPSPTTTAQPNPSPTPTSTTAPATTGTISGYVKSSSGQNTPSATVDLHCNGCSNLRGGASDSAQADGNGFYSFNNIPPGTYTIQPFYGTWGTSESVSVQAGQTTQKDLSLQNATDKVPKTTITSGPAPRHNSGDPDNFYCTNINIAVTTCCSSLKVAMEYDNSNPQYVDLGSCQTSKDTYVCQVLPAGSHTFYYKANNVACAEESLKNAQFSVP